jgi:hypothetical protein
MLRPCQQVTMPQHEALRTVYYRARMERNVLPIPVHRARSSLLSITRHSMTASAFSTLRFTNLIKTSSSASVSHVVAVKVHLYYSSIWKSKAGDIRWVMHSMIYGVGDKRTQPRMGHRRQTNLCCLRRKHHYHYQPLRPVPLLKSSSYLWRTCQLCYYCIFLNNSLGYILSMINDVMFLVCHVFR